MTPRVSIITVVRNAPQELEQTLRNLTALDTSVARVELIVIDGASTDRTPEVIRRFEDRLEYWISEPDKGLYDAMNKGIRAARGDYLWFVNAGDTAYAEDTLTKVFSGGAWGEALADVYYGETMVTAAGEAGGRELGLRSKRLPEDLDWRSLKQGMVVCHQSFIVRREIAPLYEAERYRLVADMEWVIECLKRAGTVKYTGLILSRFTEGGVSSRRRPESLLERWGIMKRHYGTWTTLRAHLGFLLQHIYRGDKYRSLS